MEQLKVELSQFGAQNPDESIAVLIDAAADITSSTEADFETLKSRKWYDRLWNIVSFKKENETILASDVASLAKLNEIVMTALTVTANENTKYYNAISESLGKIENLDDRLEHVSAALSKVALEVRNIKYGYRKSLSFSELKSSEKEMVRDFFYQYVRQLKDLVPNEASQKLYALAVEKYIPSANPRLFDGVDLLRPEVQQLLYRLDQSYYYLISGEFDDSDYFEDFAISPKTTKQIRTQITDAIKFCGTNYFINNLIQAKTIGCINDEGILYIPAEPIIDVESDPVIEPEITELVIEQMLQIPIGEEYEAQYKEIHIKSLVNCMGTVRLNHCIVYYNESENADEIKLSENAVFIATDCVFVCKGYDENKFISSSSDRGNTRAVFEGCSFYDCSAFIGPIFSLEIDNCLICNCGVDFVNGVDEYIIQNSKITFDKMAEFNFKKAKEYGAIFDIYSYADNTAVYNVEVEYDQKAYLEDFYFSIFKLSEGVITNCSFKNVTNCVSRAITVDQCLFEDCNNCVVLDNSSMFGKNKYKGRVISSRFNRCKNSIKTARENVVSQCTFEECVDEIITPVNGYPNSGTEISFCEFINCRNEQPSSFINTPVCICLSSMKKEPSSTIKNCIFDGIIIDQGFFIATHIVENTKNTIVQIRDCDFRNCWTNRESGKIIRTLDYYYPTLSNKAKYIKTIDIYNCRGLDNVHTDTADAEKSAVVSSDTSADGKKVGAVVLKGLEYVTLELLTGPVGVISGVIINKKAAQKKKEEEKLHQQYLQE